MLTQTNVVKVTLQETIKLAEQMLAAKKEALAHPPAVERRSLSARGSMPRILFMGIQKALNRGPTIEETKRWVKTQRAEIEALENTIRKMSMELASFNRDSEVTA